MKIVKCNKCGKELDESIKKCDNCGLLQFPSLRKNPLIVTGIIGIIIISITLFIGINITKSIDADKKIEAQQLKLRVEKQKRINEDAKKIEIRSELQDVFNEKKQKLVVFVKNNSDKTLSGELNATAYNQDEHIIGIGTFYPKEISANSETFGILWVDPSWKASIKYTWSELDFK